MKIVKCIRKIPIYVIIPICILFSCIQGAIQTYTNMTLSTIIGTFHIRMIYTLIIIMFVSMIVDWLSTILHNSADAKLNETKYQYWMRRVLNSKMSDINKTSTGKILSAVGDLVSYEVEIILSISNIIILFIPLIFLFIAEVQQSVIAGVVTISSIVIQVILVLNTNRFVNTNKKISEYNGKLKNVIVDDFMNLKTLKYLHQHQYGMDRLMQQQKETFPYIVNVNKHLYMQLVQFASWIPFILNIWVNRNNPEMIVFIIVNNSKIESSAEWLVYIGELLVNRKNTLRQLGNLKGDDVASSNYIQDKITLHNITFGYEDENGDQMEFYIDNMEFIKDERYLITGKSGSGKSTLANLLAGAIEPTNGIMDRFHIWYVYQETECLNDTLRNNITFGDTSISDDEIVDLFDQLEMMDWLQDRRDGLDTVVGEKGCRLSSGEKQRINVIRTIIRMRRNRNDIYVLDEITSNLDNHIQDIVIDLIDRECKSTLIIISHRSGFDQICPNHIHVENGSYHITQMIPE